MRLSSRFPSRVSPTPSRAGRLQVELLENRELLSVNVLYDHSGTNFDEDLFASNIEAALNGNVVGYGYSISVDGAPGPSGGGGIGGTGGGVAVSAPDLTALLGFPVGFSLPFNEFTEIEIASVSKNLTSIALNLAVQNHPFASLDQPMAAYLPTSWTLGNNVEGIAIRDLLAHTSGFGENYTSSSEVGSAAVSAVNVDFNTFNNNTDANLQTMVAYGVNNPGDVRQTGNTWYSNANYALMRVIIPILSGDVSPSETNPQVYADAFRDYMQTNIFQPAGVTAQLYDNSSTQARVYRPVAADPGLTSPGATTDGN